jgi:hypothetical protein
VSLHRTLAPLAAALLATACGPAPTPPVGPATQPASRPAIAPHVGGGTAAGGGPAPAPRVRTFRSAAQALEHVLASNPRIVGFGEFHQRVGAPRVDSAIRRFTRELLDTLAAETSDLVVESLAVPAHCAPAEKQAVESVKATTERPPETENEVETLLQRARARRIHTYGLDLDCKEYREVFGGKEPDYVKLLEVITRKLKDRAVEAWALRQRRRAEAAPETVAERRLIVLYGGALHNDLYPREGYEDWSYAAALQKLTAGRFVEVDLFVPEYIRGDADLKQEAWYPLFLQQAGPDRALLIERGPGAFIIVFPTTPKPAR